MSELGTIDRRELYGRAGSGGDGTDSPSCRSICFLSHLTIWVPGEGHKSAWDCMAVQSGMALQSGFLSPPLKIKRLSKKKRFLSVDSVNTKQTMTRSASAGLSTSEKRPHFLISF